MYQIAMKIGRVSLSGSWYEHFDIESSRYESEWEYEEYIRLAEPAYDTLQVLISVERRRPRCSSSHTNLWGCRLRLKTLIERETNEDAANMRTVFYAHEVATIRPIVEGHPGHDIRFYNVLGQAKAKGQSIGEVFDDPFWYFKHALIDKAHLCDTIFAVGDLVVDEAAILGKTV